MDCKRAGLVRWVATLNRQPETDKTCISSHSDVVLTEIREQISHLYGESLCMTASPRGRKSCV